GLPTTSATLNLSTVAIDRAAVQALLGGRPASADEVMEESHPDLADEAGRDRGGDAAGADAEQAPGGRAEVVESAAFKAVSADERARARKITVADRRQIHHLFQEKITDRRSGRERRRTHLEIAGMVDQPLKVVEDVLRDPRPATPTGGSDPRQEPALQGEASGIPESRRGSVADLAENIQAAAQKAKTKKTHKRNLARFQTGLAELNQKPGRTPIDAAAAEEYYRKSSERPMSLPQEIQNNRAAKAKALGVGHTAADYERHIRGERAKELGLGNTSADYVRHRKEERAKELGVGDTAADYTRYKSEERAKKLGVGDTAADYNRHAKAERAKKLGVGDTAVDYARHRKEERAKELGVGDTAADYERNRRAERARKKEAKEAGAGDAVSIASAPEERD
ncbi:MAG: hypothetical protein ACRC44_04360, partial [Bifidobacterium asteroides]